MNLERLRSLLEQVREHTLDVDACLGQLRSLPYDDLDYGFAPSSSAAVPLDEYDYGSGGYSS